jgi:hypothetical protein
VPVFKGNIGGSISIDLNVVDEKVAVDSDATPGYLGALYNDGVLRTDHSFISLTDGGDYITLSIPDDAITEAKLAMNDSPSNGEVLAWNDSGYMEWIPVSADDCKVGIDAAATPGYLGASGSDGVLRIGSGLSYTDGGDYITIANTSPNVDQNIWLTIVADTGSTAANTTSDTLTIEGGNLITTSIAGDTVTIDLDTLTPGDITGLLAWGTFTADVGSTSASVFGDTLTITGGTGISTDITGDVLTITNDSPNVAQNLWETIVAGDASSTSANATDDTLTISDGEGINTSISGDTLTIEGEDASDSNKGIASFSSDHFTVTSGNVVIKTDGIDDTLIDWGTGANQVSAVDIPIADAGGIITATEVEGALQELAGLSYWQRGGTTLSPATAGDDIDTVGMIALGDDGTVGSALFVHGQDDTLDTDATVYGIYNSYTKTAGTTDAFDYLYGSYIYTYLAQAGSTVGAIIGENSVAQCGNGTVDTFLTGIKATAHLSGGIVNDYIQGADIRVDMAAGTTAGYLYGAYVRVQKTLTSTVNNDTIGLIITESADTGADYGIYCDCGDANLFSAPTNTFGNDAEAAILKIADGSSNYISITAPSISGDYTLTLPTTDGTSNYCLITDGSGNLSWDDGGHLPGVGNVSNTGTPANNQIAIWTDATTIEGVAAFTYDGSSFHLDGSAVFNDTGADCNFRVETNDEDNMLFIDGGLNVVGINCGSPDTNVALHIGDDSAGGGDGIRIDNPPRARMYLGTTQSNIDHTAFVKVALDTDSYDSGSITNTTTNRITPGIAGYYLVTGQIYYTGGFAAGELLQTHIYVNGSSVTAARSKATGTSTETRLAQDVIYLGATDYVELYARANTAGSTADISSGSSGTYLVVHRLS